MVVSMAIAFCNAAIINDKCWVCATVHKQESLQLIAKGIWALIPLGPTSRSNFVLHFNFSFGMKLKEITSAKLSSFHSKHLYYKQVYTLTEIVQVSYTLVLIHYGVFFIKSWNPVRPSVRHVDNLPGTAEIDILTTLHHKSIILLLQVCYREVMR